MRTVTLTEAETKVLLDVCERLSRGKVSTLREEEFRYYDVYRSKNLIATLERIEEKLRRCDL